MTGAPLDPNLDLVLEREVNVPPRLVWRAWTEPELIKRWFTPHPWQTIGCEIDLRPGGKFHTVMRSPEGDEFPNSGCFLEVVPDERLIFTSMLLPDFRPAVVTSDAVHFTGIITLKPTSAGTLYRALALHADPETAKRHAAMGFTEGWGKALDQLVDVVKAL